MHVESKSLLAKLLATENITVQTKPGIQTAMFDLRNRVLMMPLWSQEVSNDLQDLLLGHETGHALDTPMAEYRSAVETITKNVFGDEADERLERTVRGFLNVIEDARIDKRQKRRYPGLRKNYLLGYKELLERDFFGTAGRDINGMNFIDRANLYFKGGNINLDIEFTPEERRLLKKIDSQESFEDAVAVTEEVYRFCKDQLGQSIDSDDIYINEEGEGEGDDGDFGFGDSDSEFDGEDGDEGFGSGDGEGEDSDVSQGQGDLPNKQDGRSTAGRRGSPGKNERAKAPTAQTDEAWEAKKKDLVKDENMSYVYIDLPEINWNKAVNDYKKVLADWRACVAAGRGGWEMSASQHAEFRREFTQWRMKEKESISFMVKEFEQRKAAEMYNRQQVARTGVIDTNKLVSYKFNDDIFRRITTIPKGKNHGFIMFLDWSGSMAFGLQNTIKQLLSLCLFCKQIQVPFEVYAFKDSYADNPFTSIGKTNCLKPGNVVLRNFLSSRMKNEDFNFAASVLWGLGAGNHINSDGMGGTPLNEAVLLASDMINEFRRKNKLEIVNTIFLTDGDGNGISTALSNPDASVGNSPLSRTKYFYTDKETGKTYEIDFTNWGRYLTPTFLKILKERTQSNLVGFFLYDGSFRGLVNRYGIASNNAQGEKAKKFWSVNNFYPVKSEGYDEYYVVSTEGLKNTTNDLKIDEKTKTNRQLAKAFSAYAQKKTINRVLLRQFIERIAGQAKKTA